MRTSIVQVRHHEKPEDRKDVGGFALAEFLISALLFLGLSVVIFGVIADMQRNAGYQSEVQAVLSNSRIALQIIERHLRQAGNDPLGTGVRGITIVSPEEFQVHADLTGSEGLGNPDKGDPDGDTDDSGESVTIRYNSRTRSLEIVTGGGSSQVVAGYIAGLAFEYYDAQGSPTTLSTEVRRVAISLMATSLLPDPQTGQIFGVKLDSTIQLLT
jgi:type II secretory pathway component PulJ